MGKASSSKKVARAARAGGDPRTRDRKWGFPLGIAAIVLVGVLLIVLVRDESVSQANEPPLLGRDHWHAAYGVHACDIFLPPLADTLNDRYGIHTHVDGLIHIHPITSRATGEDARMRRFTEEVSLEVGDETFTLPSGETFSTGDECGDGTGVVRFLKWDSGDFTSEPEIMTSGFDQVRFRGDGEAYTFFFGPEEMLDDPMSLLPPNLADVNDPQDLAPGETGANVSIPESLRRPDGGTGADTPSVLVE
jgi:hypothetical protein